MHEPRYYPVPTYTAAGVMVRRFYRLSAVGALSIVNRGRRTEIAHRTADGRSRLAFVIEVTR